MNTPNPPWTDNQVDTILDGIATDMTMWLAVRHLQAAREYDPTESRHAAWIRDAIRENFDPACDDENPALWAIVNGD